MQEFRLDERLGIPIPELSREWDDYSLIEREELLREWEEIRGRIPERIKELERHIIARQEKLDKEDDFAAACRLTWEIAGLASIINDLHIWYRVNQDVSAQPTHH